MCGSSPRYNGNEETAGSSSPNNYGTVQSSQDRAASRPLPGLGVDDMRSARTNAPSDLTESTIRSEAMRGSRTKKRSGIVRKSLFAALF